MKKLIGVALIIVLAGIPSYAITGLGFGIHGGQTNNYKYEVINNDLAEIADSLGLPVGSVKFNEDLTLIGAHVKVGTFPILDFFGYIDYAWKKKEVASGIDFKLSDFSVGADARKNFGTMILKPYVGVGFAMHRLAYSIETSLIQSPLIPEDQNKMGYHALIGVELSPPMFPITPYAQYKYAWITTKDKATKYGLIEAGITFSL